MYRILILLTCLTTLICQVQAQEETLFDDFDVVGAFGGPILEVGEINGEVGTDVGGGGALIFRNFFFGGYGLGTDYPRVKLDEQDYRLELKHGGLWFGYVPRPNKAIHFYYSTRVGWGVTDIEGEGPARESDRIFVLTPEAGFELNMTSWFRVAFTGGFRWVNGVTKLEPFFDNDDFSSPIGMITFRFGGFADTSDWDF